MTICKGTKNFRNKKSSKKNKPPYASIAKTINFERCRTQVHLHFEPCRGSYLKLKDAKKKFTGPRSKDLSLVFKTTGFPVKKLNHCDVCNKVATKCVYKEHSKRNILTYVLGIRYRGIPTSQQSTETVEYAIKEPIKNVPQIEKELYSNAMDLVQFLPNLQDELESDFHDDSYQKDTESGLYSNPYMALDLETYDAINTPDEPDIFDLIKNIPNFPT
eukprot:m.30415 g.30415  ORF g.30415 m.30415 type:complete len:217 (-) comp16280_c0_seq1:91-741(-)